MRINTVATLGAALLASGAYAADDQKVIKEDASSSSAAESSATVSVDLPTFTVSQPSPLPFHGACTGPRHSIAGHFSSSQNVELCFSMLGRHVLTLALPVAQQGQGGLRRAVHR